MAFYKTGLVFALSLGAGMIMMNPALSHAQDQHPQEDHAQHPQSTEQAHPQQSHAQHPQSTQQAHPQQNHAQHPQGTEQARPQQSHAQHPQSTQQAHPQQNHAQHPQGTEQARPQQSYAQHPQGTEQPRPQQSHAQQQSYAQQQSRGQQNRGSQARPDYQFRSQDSGRLRQYYQGGFGRIDRGHRPHFNRGSYVPRTYWSDFQPVPYDLVTYLPPVPPGYAIGYYDGYIVVYDPSTYFILSVLDILQ